MKKLYIVMVMLPFFVSSIAHSNDLGQRDFDMVVPITPDKDSTPNEVGSLVYDTSDNAFYGLDINGDWVQLSASTAESYTEAISNGLDDYSNSIASANTWGDLASITLTPGEWEIAAQANFYSNGATTTTTCIIGISPNSGNTDSGLVDGNNRMSTTKNTASGSYSNITLVRYRVSVSSNSTYYLKSYAANSITNLQKSYKLSARRVR